MAYGRKTRRRRTRRGGKKKYSVSVGKLRDKRINTLLERRMQAISKREVAKAHPAMCLRQYLWNGYNVDTNVQENFQPLTFETVQCVCQTQVPLIDNESEPLQAGGDIPETGVDESQGSQGIEGGIDAFGMTMTAPHGLLDGSRRGDSIKVSGWEALLAYKQVRALYTTLPEREYSTVLWSLIFLRNDQTTGQQYVPDQLMRKRIMAIRPKHFGFHSRLDPTTDNVQKQVSFQTLASGKIRCPIGDKTINRVRKIFWRPKNPKTISYRGGDHKGQYAIKGHIYLLLCSDTSASAPYNLFLPSVTVCTKLFYRDI